MQKSLSEDCSKTIRFIHDLHEKKRRWVFSVCCSVFIDWPHALIWNTYVYCCIELFELREGLRGRAMSKISPKATCYTNDSLDKRIRPGAPCDVVNDLV